MFAVKERELGPFVAFLYGIKEISDFKIETNDGSADGLRMIFEDDEDGPKISTKENLYNYFENVDTKKLFVPEYIQENKPLRIIKFIPF